eukprot:scaffold34176_cov51-Isochrysis_galbana.AAC.1
MRQGGLGFGGQGGEEEERGQCVQGQAEREDVEAQRAGESGVGAWGGRQVAQQVGPVDPTGQPEIEGGHQVEQRDGGAEHE